MANLRCPSRQQSDDSGATAEAKAAEVVSWRVHRPGQGAYDIHPSGWPRPKMRGVSPATAGVRANRATGPWVTTVPKSSDGRSSRSPRRAQKLSGAIVDAR